MMQMITKTASYILLIFKDGSEIDFQKNICLTGKIICQWKYTLLLSINKIKRVNNLKYNLMILMFKLKKKNTTFHVLPPQSRERNHSLPASWWDLTQDWRNVFFFFFFFFSIIIMINLEI